MADASGSPRQRRRVIAAVDALLLDQPAAVELHAEIFIEAHGVERPGVGRGKPLHHLPIRAHHNPARGALERYVLHPVLTTAPPWLGEGLARPAPYGNTLSGRRLHDAIRGECRDHGLDTAPVVGPHVAAQHILDAKAIVHADFGCHRQISPSLLELQRPSYWAARLRASRQLQLHIGGTGANPPPRKSWAIRGSVRILAALSSIRVWPCSSTSASSDICSACLAFCSISTIVTPLSRRSFKMPNTSPTITGERPIDGSSIRISLGSSNSPRAISSIFCWPPDRVDACVSAFSCSIGKRCMITASRPGRLARSDKATPPSSRL